MQSGKMGEGKVTATVQGLMYQSQYTIEKLFLKKGNIILLLSIPDFLQFNKEIEHCSTLSGLELKGQPCAHHTDVKTNMARAAFFMNLWQKDVVPNSTEKDLFCSQYIHVHTKTKQEFTDKGKPHQASQSAYHTPINTSVLTTLEILCTQFSPSKF